MFSNGSTVTPRVICPKFALGSRTWIKGTLLGGLRSQLRLPVQQGLPLLPPEFEPGYGLVTASCLSCGASFPQTRLQPRLISLNLRQDHLVD